MIAGLLAALAGCGGSNTDEAPDSQGLPSASATPTSAVDEPTPTESAVDGSTSVPSVPASPGSSAEAEPKPTISDLMATGTWAAWDGARESVASSSKDGTLETPPVGEPVVSGNGRFIALVAGNSKLGCPDGILVKELATGDLECASTTSEGKPALDGSKGRANSSRPALSADGRTVAFTSNAANLVPRPRWSHVRCRPPVRS